MPNVKNSPLAGLLAQRQGAPQPAAAPSPPPPKPEGEPNSAVSPATPEQIARHGLPPGAMQIKLAPDDPAFEKAAAAAAAQGLQVVQVGGGVFAVPPPQPTQSPQGGLLSDQGNAPPSGAPAKPQGGLLA